jgi:hypothetical protein
MNAGMVFIHGRAQEGRDPGRLQSEWSAALAAGTAAAGKAIPAGVSAAFPYYGNLLFEITADVARNSLPVNLERVAEDAEDIPFHPYLTPDVGAVERALAADMAAAAGCAQLEGLDRLLSWPAARRSLEWLASNTRIDRQVITRHLQDVAVYLTHGRDRVLKVVRDAFPASGPVVLVSHSLGTVVAYDVLQDADLRARTALWVTTGSPLGLRTVQRNSLAGKAQHPGIPWLTAYDVNDIVALGHPLTPEWGGPVRQLAVENDEAPHSISRYLGHAEVAGPIADALLGT